MSNEYHSERPTRYPESKLGLGNGAEIPKAGKLPTEAHKLLNDSISVNSSHRSRKRRGRGGKIVPHITSPTYNGHFSEPAPGSDVLIAEVMSVKTETTQSGSRNPSSVSTVTHSDLDGFGNSVATTLETAETEMSRSDIRHDGTDTSSRFGKNPVQQYILDDTTGPVVKLPNEFLRKSERFMLHSPFGDGWYRSTDGTLQYVEYVKGGKLVIRDRQSGNYWSLDDLLSASTRNKTSPSVIARNPLHTLASTFTTRNASFFKVGTVFRMLFTEPCTDPKRRGSSPSIFAVKYGESVYSQIGVFVVVQLRKGFCYACRISDYDGLATTKPGCNAGEHAPVYVHGRSPTIRDDEVGMKKAAIGVVMTKMGPEGLKPLSRIHFGRGQPVQYNVKAEEVGQVASQHLPLLISYWREEICGDCQDDVVPYAHPEVDTSSRAETSEESRRADQSHLVMEHLAATRRYEHVGNSVQKDPRRDVFLVNGIENIIISEISGPLHSGFEYIDNPRGYFKKGRAFMVYWPELAGSPESERTIYWKVRRFVVVKPSSSYCLCYMMSTYQGKGTAKSGVSSEDHVAVLPVAGTETLHTQEESLPREPLYIKVEDPSIDIDSMSRVNLGKIYTVEYNLKVRRIGRIVPESIRKMEEYFKDIMRIAARA